MYLNQFDKMLITKEIYETLSATSRFLKYNSKEKIWEEVSWDTIESCPIESCPIQSNPTTMKCRVLTLVFPSLSNLRLVLWQLETSAVMRKYIFAEQGLVSSRAKI